MNQMLFGLTGHLSPALSWSELSGISSNSFCNLIWYIKFEKEKGGLLNIVQGWLKQGCNEMGNSKSVRFSAKLDDSTWDRNSHKRSS